MRTFRPYDSDQDYLLPPSVNDWLSADHLARFVKSLVHETLDLSEVLRLYDSKSGRGAPPHDPRMMFALLLYCYLIGICSSRRIEKATYDDLGARFLTGNQHPDHDSIADFRKRCLPVFKRLVSQSLDLCAEAQMLKLGDIDLYMDGTKMLANASRSRTVGYETVRKTQEQFEQIVEELLAEAERTDAEDDAREAAGVDQPPNFKDRQKTRELLRAAKERLEQAAKARQRLEEEAREQAQQAVAEAAARRLAHEQANKPGRKPSVSDAATVEQTLLAKARINLTDPDSRLMRDGATKAIVQAYNCQAVVAQGCQIIVACDVTNEENDLHQLAPMAQKAAEQLGALGAAQEARRRLGADAGYLTVEGVSDPRTAPFDLYIAPGAGGQDEAKEATVPVEPEPSSGIIWYTPADPPLTPAALLREQMRQKIATPEGRDFYAQRAASVEPVFGQTKQARGIRRLWLRGLDSSRGEWSLICATHNLLKLFRKTLRDRQQEQASPVGNRPNKPHRALPHAIQGQLAYAEA